MDNESIEMRFLFETQCGYAVCSWQLLFQILISFGEFNWAKVSAQLIGTDGGR